MRLIVLGARSFAGLTTPCKHTSKPEGQRICCRFGQSSGKVGLSEFPRPTTPRTLQSHPTSKAWDPLWARTMLQMWGHWGHWCLLHFDVSTKMVSYDNGLKTRQESTWVAQREKILGLQNPRRIQDVTFRLNQTPSKPTNNTTIHTVWLWMCNIVNSNYPLCPFSYKYIQIQTWMKWS